MRNASCRQCVATGALAPEPTLEPRAPSPSGQQWSQEPTGACHSSTLPDPAQERRPDPPPRRVADEQCPRRYPHSKCSRPRTRLRHEPRPAPRGHRPGDPEPTFRWCRTARSWPKYAGALNRRPPVDSRVRGFRAELRGRHHHDLADLPRPPVLVRWSGVVVVPGGDGCLVLDGVAVARGCCAGEPSTAVDVAVVCVGGAAADEGAGQP
jgi:hypothetical protein